jgi:hypothetical protein
MCRVAGTAFALCLGLAVAGCARPPDEKAASAEPGYPLVPDLLDGTTLNAVDAALMIKLRSPSIARFSLSGFSINRGAEVVGRPEAVQTNHDSLELTLAQVLEPGSYELRFRVGDVDESRLRPYFVPVEGEPRSWRLRFFIGSQFCLVQAGVCWQQDATKARVYLRFSDTSSRISAEAAAAAVRVQFNGRSSACEAETATGEIASSELTLQCALPEREQGDAALLFTGELKGGPEAVSLSNCTSGAPLPEVRFDFSRGRCGQYKW